MTQSSPPLPELAEADAPPDIARIYQEIRTLSGVPMVALIWRHLATMPGVLPAVWDGLGPLFHEGSLQRGAWAAARVDAEPAALAFSGLDANTRATFERVLGAYNRANPVNFVAVRALLHSASADIPAAAPPGSPAAASKSVPGPFVPPASIAGLPPMTPPDKIPVDLRGLIDDLSTDARIDRGRVVPSLYRHLIPWPGLLREMHTALAPRIRSGEIGGIIAGVAAAMDSEARRMASRLTPVAVLQQQDEVRFTLERFSLLIPEMVVIGLLLQGGIEARR